MRLFRWLDARPKVLWTITAMIAVATVFVCVSSIIDDNRKDQ